MPTQIYKNAAGERIPGTTTIIGQNLGWNKQALMWWANQEGQAGRNHRDTAQKAADAGTLAHLMAECAITGKVFVMPEGVEEETQKLAEKAYEAYLNWQRMSKIEIPFAEIPLISERLQYGGTLDGIGVIGPSSKLLEYCLIDFKTSNDTYGDHLIQLAAYQLLWEENHPDKPLDGGFHLLRFGKVDGSFHHHWYPDLTNAAEAFQHLRALHNLKKDIEKAA